MCFIPENFSAIIYISVLLVQDIHRKIQIKFIDRLTAEEYETLTEAYCNHSSFRVRQRAHAV
jgi:hypothetical protein